MVTTAPVTGIAAGVPFVAQPPTGGPRPDAPVVVTWHLLDAPRTEAAFAAALPMAGLDAWRFHLGLPMCGSRMPAGGLEEVMALGYDDAVLRLYGPINAGAADEFPAALDALRDRFGLARGPLGLLGGSAGAGVVQETLTRRDDVVAAAIVSPLVQLRPLVDWVGPALFGFTYAWTPGSDAVAAQMDYVARAGEIGDVPVRIVLGEDDTDAILDPARRLDAALAGPHDLVTIPGMGHALAEEPGVEAAPQTPHAAVVDAHVVDWFRQYLAP